MTRLILYDLQNSVCVCLIHWKWRLKPLSRWRLCSAAESTATAWSVSVCRSHLTFLPQTEEVIGDVWDDVAVVVGDGAAAQLRRLSIQDLLTQLLQLGVVTVEQEVSSKFFKPINRAETTVSPETAPLLWTETENRPLIRDCYFMMTTTCDELTFFCFFTFLRTWQMTFYVFTEVFHLTEGFLARSPFTTQLESFLLEALFWRHLKVNRQQS